MSFTLGDITQLNPKMADINDVQLSWYPDDKRNAQLCEFYIWSNHAVNGAKSSIELLEKVREAFLMTSSPRRFIFRATYGHGKTHLALALANFFGRGADSPEVQSILEQLRASAPAKAEGFATFKAEREPYLVLRLFGENVSNLPQAVVTALELALRENPASASYQLDFWFEKALEGFEKFGAEQIARANDFLAARSSDFPTLCQKLRDRDGDSFESACQLVEEITGFSPNFGRAVELDKLLVQVTADLCGEGKPFSGLLILFDEFSAFTRSYAQDYVLKRGTPLQSLLDGVGNCGHLAAIVALSQYDPNSDVQTIFQRLNASTGDRQNIEKELNRLPEPNRYQLYSSLELVLANLLRQDEANWDTLTHDDKIWEQIGDATNDTMRLYEAHYSEEMGWGDEKLQTVLTKGCFPFHPLTIAILCKSNLRGDESGARTVMGYLTEALRENAARPALTDGVLSWISPVSLVEKFGRAIVFEDVLWNQYWQTWRSAGGDHASEAQKAVLRAMLLHEVVGLKVSRMKGSYELNIAVLSGLASSHVEAALQELLDAGYLKRDETRNVYAFWPIGEDGSKVEAPLQHEVTATLNDATKLRAALEKSVAKWKGKDEEIAGAPGHPQDWSAEMWIAPRVLFDAERLRALAQPYRLGKYGIEEAPRGIVVSLVATTNDDLTYFKTNARRVLDEALANLENPPPLVLRVPRWLQGNFVKTLVREQVLLGWDADKKREVGLKPYEEVLEATRLEIEKNWKDYETDCYEVPLAYRSLVDARSISGQLMSLPNLLKTCYDGAYRNAPPFFIQDKQATAALKKATKTACEFFLKGTFTLWNSDSGVQNAGKTKSLFDKFLVEGESKSWGVVDTSHRICEPKADKIRQAWNALEAAVAPGAENVNLAPAVLSLMNAPWGYDFNTVSLLLCAWCGYHQSQIETQTSSGRVANLRECLANATDFKKFLEDVLCVKQLRFTRRDAAETKKSVEETIEKIRLKAPFARDEAKIAIAQLQIFADDANNETRLIGASQSASAQLQGDLKLAEDYAVALESLRAKIESASSISDALKALDEARSEIAFGCVRPHFVLSAGELTADAMERLAQVTENFCVKREALGDIRDVSKYTGELQTARKWFDERGLSDLRARVQTAFGNLAEREAELQSESKDAESVAALKSLKRETNLQNLRVGLRELDDYESNSPKTEVAIADAKGAMQTTLENHLAWFAPLEAQLDAATSNGELSKIYRDIARYSDRFVGSPEGKQLELFEKRIETLGKNLVKLADLNREKPRNNADLKKLDSAFEKLKDHDALSPAQQEFIERARAEVDQRFVAQVEAARSELESYQARNENGEDAVALKNALEGALAREMAYLADEHKPQLRALDRALQRRIDDDEIKRVEANFLKIRDAAKRRECLKLLQKHAGLEAETSA